VCTCPPGSPFLWQTYEPTINWRRVHLDSEKSERQTEAKERLREEGKDLSPSMITRKYKRE
jgi:hypothetical protein